MDEKHGWEKAIERPEGKLLVTNGFQQAPFAHSKESDSAYKAALVDSLPKPMPALDSWSGASGSEGGKAGKTFKGA